MWTKELQYESLVERFVLGNAGEVQSVSSKHLPPIRCLPRHQTRSQHYPNLSNLRVASMLAACLSACLSVCPVRLVPGRGQGSRRRRPRQCASPHKQQSNGAPEPAFSLLCSFSRVKNMEIQMLEWSYFSRLRVPIIF